MIDRHVEAITGMAFDTATAELYSVSKDKYFIQTSINLLENPNAPKGIEKVFPEYISKMCYDKKNKNLYLGSSNGTIYIFGTENKIQLLHQMTP